MRIIHLSYAPVLWYSDPQAWLKRISFFTGIAEEMGRLHDVASIHTIAFDGEVKSSAVTYYFLRATRWQLIFPHKINRFLREQDPDVVIIHGFHFSWPSLLLRMVLRKRVKFFLQHHAERPLRFPKSILQQGLDRFISGYFFTSHALAEGWVQRKQIRNRSVLHEVMEASSTFHYEDRESARAKTGVTGHRVYLWIGRFDENKDPITLIKAFEEFERNYKHAKLYIIYQKDDLNGVVERMTHSQSVVFVGKLDHDQMIHWCNSADFIISTSHYEGSGIAVCEAMSCGCIPILSDIPSFRMMTDEGKYGLLFERGNIQSLVHALNKSASISIEEFRPKVLHRFDEALSFKAIAGKMIDVIESKL
jgi:glycosyltransferase involved in cell wall biosynthesis